MKAREGCREVGRALHRAAIDVHCVYGTGDGAFQVKVLTQRGGSNVPAAKNVTSGSVMCL